jgi:hypothetical protein
MVVVAGATVLQQWEGKYDGKDYPYKGNANVDMLATTRVDANTYAQVVKKDGKQIGTAREVFSKDGKTLTRTGKEKTPQGQVEYTLVFEKRVVMAAAAEDPFAGAWKLNVAKSKYNPGPAPNRSSIVRIERQGDVLKVVSDSVTADGKSNHSEQTEHLDGKDHPVSGDPNRDTANTTRIDEYPTVTIFKKAGHEVGSRRSVVSKDGKTLTLTIKGKNPQGKDMNNVAVFEKQ